MITLDDHTQSARWQAVAAQLAAVTDSLGTPIDPGILPTCIALNVLGFATSQSCEGHLEWGERAPWVEIMSAEADAANTQAQAAFLNGRVVDATRPDSWPRYHHEAVVAGSAWRAKADSILAGEQDRLFDYLHHFYAERPSPPDRRLTIQTNMPHITLLTRGTAGLIDRDAETQRRKLLEYQDEMRDFTDYLIATHLS